MTSSQSTGHCNNSSSPKSSSNSHNRASQTEDLTTERPLLSGGLLVNKSSQTDLSALDPSCSPTDSVADISETVPSRHTPENASNIVASGDGGSSSTQREAADTDGSIVRQDSSTERQPNASTSREDAMKSSEMLDGPECRQEDEHNDPSTGVNDGSEDQATSLERGSSNPLTTTVQENLTFAGNGAVVSDSLLSSGSTCIDEREGNESAQHLNHAPPTDCGGETHTSVDNRESGKHSDNTGAQSAAQVACDEVSVAQDHVASDREVGSTGRRSTAGIASHTADTAAEHFTMNEGAALGSLPLTAESSTLDPPGPRQPVPNTIAPIHQNNRASTCSTNTISTGALQQNRQTNTILTTACRDSCPLPYSTNTTPTRARQDNRPPPYSANTTPTRARRDSWPLPYSSNTTPTRARQDNRPPLYSTNTTPTRARRDSCPLPYSSNTTPTRACQDSRPPPYSTNTRSTTLRQDNRPPPYSTNTRSTTLRQDNRPPPYSANPRSTTLRQYSRPPPYSANTSSTTLRQDNRPPSYLTDTISTRAAARRSHLMQLSPVTAVAAQAENCAVFPPQLPPGFFIPAPPPPCGFELSQNSVPTLREAASMAVYRNEIARLLNADCLYPGPCRPIPVVHPFRFLPPLLLPRAMCPPRPPAYTVHPPSYSQIHLEPPPAYCLYDPFHDQQMETSHQSERTSMLQQLLEMGVLEIGALEEALEIHALEQAFDMAFPQPPYNMGASRPLEETNVSQQRAETAVSRHSQEPVVSQRSRATDISLQSPETEMSQLSVGAEISQHTLETDILQQSQQTETSQQSQATGFSHLQEPEISRQLLEAHISQQSLEAHISQQSLEADVSQQSQDAGFALQSEDAGIALQSQDTGNGQRSQYTGIARQSQAAGNGRRSQYTGIEQQSQAAGNAQRSQDSGFARQSQDTGTAQQSQDGGIAQQSQDLVFAQQSQDSGFAQRSLPVMQPVEFFIPVPVDLQHPPPQLAPLPPVQEVFPRGCRGADMFTSPRQDHSRHGQYYHERLPYNNEFACAEHHRHSTFAQRRGHARGCPPRLPRLRRGCPSQPQFAASTLPDPLSRYPSRGRGIPEQFQVHRARRGAAGRSRHHGTSCSQTSDDSSDESPFSA